jgi:hypothetical protein
MSRHTCSRTAGLVPPGGRSAPITLTAHGTLGHHCAIHPGTVGALDVTQ